MNPDTTCRCGHGQDQHTEIEHTGCSFRDPASSLCQCANYDTTPAPQPAETWADRWARALAEIDGVRDVTVTHTDAGLAVTATLKAEDTR
jgi:hypothetical protein